MKIAFVKDSKLGKVKLALLAKANQIIEDYAAQGYTLTLRQLYYQLVTQNVIPNKDKEYSKLSSLLTKGRMSGLVDWDAIADRLRVPRIVQNFDTMEEAVTNAAEQYVIDRMKGQPNYVELWVEKDALSNILARKTQHYVIRLMVNRGYSSTTAIFDSYNRIRIALEEGKTANILYLGDHDPSGLDMVRDIYERLFLMLTNKYRRRLFDRAEEFGEDALYEKYSMNKMAIDEEGFFDIVKAYVLEKFFVKHIGLTTEQVKQYDPPPNPAKLTDPRAEWYIALHGPISWEVDALNPATLHEIIDTEVEALVDMEMFNKQVALEEIHINQLKELPTLRTDNVELTNYNLDLTTALTQKEETVTNIKDFLSTYKLPAGKGSANVAKLISKIENNFLS